MPLNGLRMGSYGALYNRDRRQLVDRQVGPEPLSNRFPNPPIICSRHHVKPHTQLCRCGLSDLRCRPPNVSSTKLLSVAPLTVITAWRPAGLGPPAG